MANKKKDQFESFLEKSFGDLSKEVKVAKGTGDGRASSYEERARQVAADDAGRKVLEQNAVAETQPSTRKIGRPSSRPEGKEQVKMSLILEADLKHKLELLRVNEYRSSLTELIKEAIRDLLVKYRVN